MQILHQYLTNLRTLSLSVQIRIGGGTYLAATAAGTLQINGVMYPNFLPVSKLASNLVSVGATPPDC
jgi:hypothetical protein